VIDQKFGFVGDSICLSSEAIFVSGFRNNLKGRLFELFLNVKIAIPISQGQYSRVSCAPSLL
jgi:hypothetical protein